MSRSTRPSRTAIAAALGVMLSAALLSGCETTQEAGGGLNEDVTLRDLVPATTASVESISAESAATDSEAAPIETPSHFGDHRLVIRRMVFRRQAPRLRMALDALIPPAVGAETLRRWEANGLHIGEVERGQLELLLANVPDAMGISDAVRTGPAAWSPQVLLERVAGLHRVDYVHPDGRTERYTLRGGRQQFMMRFERPDSPGDGVLRLAILPHHYKPRRSLLPRSPLDKALDGTPWHDLTLRAPAPTRRAWVIWAEIPLPPEPARPEPLEPSPAQAPLDGPPADAPADPPTDAPIDASEPDDADAPDETDSKPPRFRPLPDVFDRHVDTREAIPLGEAMMTGMRGDDAAQVVLIVLVEAPPAPDEADGADAEEPEGS